MLHTLLKRLADLLMQDRIGYTDLQAIVTDLTHLSATDLDTLITRWDAIHRLLLALKAKRPGAATSGTTAQSEVH